MECIATVNVILTCGIRINPGQHETVLVVGTQRISPQESECVRLEEGCERICCTYCNKHSYKQFVT